MSNNLYTLPPEAPVAGSSSYAPVPTAARGAVQSADFYSLPSFLPEDPIRPVSNITPVPEGSTVRTGVFKSPKYTPNRSGWQVDSDGNSEFSKLQVRNTFVTVPLDGDIQGAVNIMSDAGGGEVRLGSGSYFPTADIVIPSNVALVGVGANTVIDFNNTAFQIKLVGTDNYSTGTVTINNDSSTLTGSGTTWTTAMEGRSILIGAYWYVILTVGSTTSITLDGVFLEKSVVAASYVIATTVDSASLKNFLVQNSTSALIKMQFTNGSTVDSVIGFNGLNVIDGDDSSFINLFSCSAIDCANAFNFSNFHYGTAWNFNIQNCTGNGFTANNITQWGFEIFMIINCSGKGMEFTNCHNNGIEDFSIASNTGIGIEFVSNNYDMTLSDGWVGDGTTDGIKLTATSDRIDMVSMHLINNGGWGINIAASTCDNNTLNVPTFSGNVSGTYTNSGTDTNIVLSSSNLKAQFGGDGSDGALTITSGTTTVNLGAASIVQLNYSSISITGTGKLAFSNPGTNGTIIILKSQGAVVLTSSTNPCIDASGMGAAGGAGAASPGVGANGSVGVGLISTDSVNGKGGVGSTDSTGGVAYTTNSLIYTKTASQLFTKAYYLYAGNGGGGSGCPGNSNGAGGTGGRGGGGLKIECAGALNFTGTISVAGASGTNGANNSAGSSSAAGGGGGGSAGSALVLYNSLTANSGTITATGGAGGTSGLNLGAAPNASGNRAGGSGAGSFTAAGGIGSGTTNGSNAVGLGSGGGGAGATVSAVTALTGGTGGGSESGLIAQVV